jgi:hypothetical protein
MEYVLDRSDDRYAEDNHQHDGDRAAEDNRY